MSKCVFVGLTTVDLIFLVKSVPGSDEKVRAIRELCCAGGPATNAAIAFSHLGRTACLVSSLGCHPLAAVAKDEIDTYGVKHVDLAPGSRDVPFVASVAVTQATGERSVVAMSSAADGIRLEDTKADEIVRDARLIMVDGHSVETSLQFAGLGKKHGVPVMLDSGNWKAGMERLLGEVDIAICPETFAFPDGENGSVVDRLSAFGIGQIAITRGAKSVIYREGDRDGEVSVPSINAVDTLGAGDIFHGAFCYGMSGEGLGFVESLEYAAGRAACSCEFFGPRGWMG